MNTSIKRLYEKTIGKEWAYDFDPDLAEKFAELIIKEMLMLTYDEESRYYVLGEDYLAKVMENYRELAKEHFGVE